MATLEQRVTSLEKELLNLKAKINDVLSDILNDRKQARGEEARLELETQARIQRLRRRITK